MSCKAPSRCKPSDHAEASRASSLLSRLDGLPSRAAWALWFLLGSIAGLLLVPRLASGFDVAAGLRSEVVVSGVPRPVQLAFDGGGALVVLSQGWRGDAAGEVYRFDRRASFPVDASRAPRVVIPFADEPRKTLLGSLAADPDTGELFLGEENGNRIYRLGVGHRLEMMVVGLNHLLGGSSITLDRRGRLVFLDYASPEMHLRSEAPLPPSLMWLTEEAYRGPVVFRVDVHEDRPLPRRADLLLSILPQQGSPGMEPLWRLIAVTSAGDDLVFLSAIGEVFRVGLDGALRSMVRLPAGHYHRTNLAAARDGSVFVCGGFHIRRIYRIAPDGAVSLVASELGDPGGIVLDDAGALYVAETALHRIIRITPNP